MKSPIRRLVLLFVCSFAAGLPASETSLPSRQAQLFEGPPRKVVVATVCQSFDDTMDLGRRAAVIDRLVSEAQTETNRRYAGCSLDLFILPEYVLQRPGANASERAVRIDDPAVRRVAALAGREKAWIILTLILCEDVEGHERYSNAAVLVNRAGQVAGIYRKVHPITTDDGSFENGTTPGDEYPVFTTDFGKVGIQICWDMSYEEGWKALAEVGAELVALPSASPQNIRPASYAQRYRYWIVNATPRDNVSVFNPIGLIDAQRTEPGVLVHRFDLVSAPVHWTEQIQEGRTFRQRYGDRGGFVWSAREDTGLFWSNDSALPIGRMLHALNVEPIDAQVERVGAELNKAKR